MARQKSGFEKLVVYALTEELADAIWRGCRTWPPLDRDTVGRQLIRAADSVGANIAEGYGRGTRADNRRRVRIAIGSLYETKHWLRRAFRRDLLTGDQTDALRPILEKLLPMLNGYYRSLNARDAPTKTQDEQPTTHNLQPTTHE